MPRPMASAGLWVTYRIGMPSVRCTCLQPLEEGLAIRQVERRDRLVAEQEPRPRRQRPCQAHALPLAAGERLRGPIEQVFHAAERGDLSHASLRLGPALSFSPKPMLSADAEVGEEEVVLEDHADPPPAKRLRRCRADASKSTESPSRIDPESGRESPVISRRIEVFPDPEGPKITPISAPSRSATSIGQSGVDSTDEPDIKNRRLVAQRLGPRAGSVRCTSQSAAIETSEIQSVSQAARVRVTRLHGVVDGQRGGLGQARDVARHHHRGTEVAEGPGKGQHGSRGQSPPGQRQGDRPEDRELVAAEQSSHVFERRVHRLEGPASRQEKERKRRDRRGHHGSRPVKDQHHSQALLEPAAQPGSRAPGSGAGDSPGRSAAGPAAGPADPPAVPCPGTQPEPGRRLRAAPARRSAPSPRLRPAPRAREGPDPP